MSTTIDEDWTLQAACAKRSPDELFVQGAAQRQVREICFQCPVRIDCLVDALDNRIQFGVWGGMTERERRALLRSEPDVDSWRAMLGEVNDSELDEFVGIRRSRRAMRAVGA
ncbi:WhiB family transcriptional regulator [Ruania rhizosphaerae]|uniref:WhiB family transcriptional regulator n=1 Tax=Ruania rhizosphaerae TaxID=1840413 RepID=UPI00135B90E3|nr:WhiB family transcriptional regulator [Ruania rhizosphaerae]